MIKKIKQRDITDCGACCLAAVANHFGIRISVSRLREIAGTDQSGTSVLGLIQASEAIGLSARGVKGQYANISSAFLPMVAHVRLQGGLEHFVVVVKMKPRTVLVMDPSAGALVTWTKEDFIKKWTGIAVLFSRPTKTVAETPTDRHAGLRYLLTLLLPHRRQLLESFCGALIASLLGLSGALYVRAAVDHVVGDGNWRLLNLLSLGMVMVITVRSLISWMQARMHQNMAQCLDAQLLTDYHRHIMSLSQQFFDSLRVGEILSRINDAVRIRTFLNETVLQLLVNSTILVFSLALIAILSAKLAALIIVVITGVGLLSYFGHGTALKLQERAYEAYSGYTVRLHESLQYAGTLKKLGHEMEAVRKTEESLAKALRKGAEFTQKTSLFGAVNNWAVQLIQVGILWWGISAVLDGELTLGDSMACYTLGAFLLGPLNGLLSSVGQLQQCLPAAQRLFEIFDLVVEENSGRLMLPQERGVDIRLRNLSFAFPGRGRLLTDVNVVMPRGKVTLFTGPSGGGKSTLLALLIAQHRPTNGEVLLDGVGIDHYDLAGLRHSVGFVPQRIDLFSRDLLSNLTMDDPNPDLRRVLSLCQRVGLDSMIESLPSKLHTEVRDGGVNFSGGQRQKMAVVRALYRNPKLLLMDEPTSAYDAESEDQFLQLLSDLRSEGCTIVIASHSARIHAIADLVYEIRAGIVQAKLGQRSTSPLLSA